MFKNHATQHALINAGQENRWLNLTHNNQQQLPTIYQLHQQLQKVGNSILAVYVDSEPHPASNAEQQTGTYEPLLAVEVPIAIDPLFDNAYDEILPSNELLCLLTHLVIETRVETDAEATFTRIFINTRESKATIEMGPIELVA